MKRKEVEIRKQQSFFKKGGRLLETNNNGGERESSYSTEFKKGSIEKRRDILAGQSAERWGADQGVFWGGKGLRVAGASNGGGFSF